MTERKHRATSVESAPPQSDPSRTQEMDAVLVELGSTVTVTEPGAALDLEAHDFAQRATLVLLAGATPGRLFTLREYTVIGRDPLADIQIEDSAVSRRHARITQHEAGYLVEDLNSVNGTFVSGTRIIRRKLQTGDRIQLGSRIVLRFALLDPAEEAMHRQLFESSTRDPLTGAWNKRYVTERLTAEVAHAVRHRTALEIVVFDIDKFKHVNDHYGHLVGDAVLRAVADRVHSVIRSEDVFGRFGGEEFVVISRVSNAAKLAERLRSAIADLTIPTDHGPVQVTVSLGVARLDEVIDRTADGLLERADLRLLEAKRHGRNCVWSCDRDLPR